MRAGLTIVAVGAALLAVPAAAQLALPQVHLPAPALIGGVLDGPTELLGNLGRSAAGLLQLRLERTDRLLRRNRATIELDARGEPARRGELLIVDPSPAELAAVKAGGFAVTGGEEMGSLGLVVVRVVLPRGVSLAQGEARLHRIAPAAEIAADNLHFQAGSAAHVVSSAAAPAQPIAIPVGVIDGGPGTGAAIMAVRGFADGAPRASNHGSAVVSLLQGAGARDVRVADIYGSDPAGGNALALVRALDWLLSGGARVISISLSGPPNAAVAKAVAAAQRRGAVIVAAVGNDGPAAPPSYPASYPGVIAVTAVDARNRPLIEAGRAAHLDYAAPGADIVARNAAGQWVTVRGTSFAVPLVAARAAAALGAPSWRATLDREAEDLGAPGADPQFGRGLLCRACARRR